MALKDKLREFLPLVYRNSTVLDEFLEAIGELFDNFDTVIDNMKDYSDPLNLDEDRLEQLARQFGINFPRNLGLAAKRSYVAEAVDLYRSNGTQRSLIRSFKLLGWSVDVIECWIVEPSWYLSNPSPYTLTNTVTGQFIDLENYDIIFGTETQYGDETFVDLFDRSNSQYVQRPIYGEVYKGAVAGPRFVKVPYIRIDVNSEDYDLILDPTYQEEEEFFIVEQIRNHFIELARPAHVAILEIATAMKFDGDDADIIRMGFQDSLFDIQSLNAGQQYDGTWAYGTSIDRYILGETMGDFEYGTSNMSYYGVNDDAPDEVLTRTYDIANPRFPGGWEYYIPIRKDNTLDITVPNTVTSYVYGLSDDRIDLAQGVRTRTLLGTYTDVTNQILPISGYTGVEIKNESVGGAIVYSALVLADFPIAYYTLNDTGTTLSDSSGNGNDGTYVGDFTVGQAGIVTNTVDNKSTTFNGSSNNGYGEVSSSLIYDVLGGTYNGDFTIEAWIHPTAINGAAVNCVYEEFFDNSNRIVFFLEDSAMQMRVNFIPSTSSTLVGNKVLSLNTTYFVQYRHIPSKNRREIWIDGVLDVFDTTPETYTGAVPTTTRIGNTNSADRSFKGKIDELAIYADTPVFNFISDNFTDVASTELVDHVMDDGNGWVTFKLNDIAGEDSTQEIITGNQAQILSDNHGVLTNVEQINHVISIDWVLGNAVDNRTSILLRSVDSENFTYLNCNEPSGTIAINSVVATTFNTAEQTTFSFVDGTTYNLTVIAAGNRIIGMVDGEVIVAKDDTSFISTGLNAGFMRNAAHNDMRYDNFKIYHVENFLLDTYTEGGTTTASVAWTVSPPDGATWIWDVDNSQAGVAGGDEVKMQQLLFVPVDTEIQFTGMSDNFCDFYIDGTLIGDFDGYLATKSYTLTLSAGVHRILLHGVNGDVVPNPAGVTMSAKRTSDSKVLLRTDGYWTASTNAGF